MATDLEALVRSLTTFYPFAGKTVIAVGAGGGQLIEYALEAKRVVAVDIDAAAIAGLERKVRALGIAEKLELVTAEWLAANPKGDVVLFEFCLHAMPDPASALAHAKQVAPDVFVADHAPGSSWERLAAEDKGVEAAWMAVDKWPVKRQMDLMAFQRFDDYAALAARFAAQSPASKKRIAPYRKKKPITIEMPYRLALL